MELVPDSELDQLDRILRGDVPPGSGEGAAFLDHLRTLVEVCEVARQLIAELRVLRPEATRLRRTADEAIGERQRAERELSIARSRIAGLEQELRGAA